MLCVARHSVLAGNNHLTSSTAVSAPGQTLSSVSSTECQLQRCPQSALPPESLRQLGPLGRISEGRYLEFVDSEVAKSHESLSRQ